MLYVHQGPHKCSFGIHHLLISCLTGKPKISPEVCTQQCIYRRKIAFKIGGVSSCQPIRTVLLILSEDYTFIRSHTSAPSAFHSPLCEGPAPLGWTQLQVSLTASCYYYHNTHDTPTWGLILLPRKNQILRGLDCARIGLCSNRMQEVQLKPYILCFRLQKGTQFQVELSCSAKILAEITVQRCTRSRFRTR